MGTADRVEGAVREAGVERLSRVLGAIRRINHLICVSTDARTLLSESAEALVAARGYAAAWISASADDGRPYVTQHGWTSDDFERFVGRWQTGWRPPCGEPDPSCRSVRVVNGPHCNDCALRGIHIESGAIAAEIRYGGEVLGRMCVALPAHIRPSPDELGVVQDVADDLGLGLHKIAEEDARRRAEARYEELYHSAPDMLLSVDLETRCVTQCNATALRLTGRTRDELIGRPFAHLCDRDSHDVAARLLDDPGALGAMLDPLLHVVTSDGRVLEVSIRVGGARDDQGRPERRVSLRDVTEKRRLQEQLAQSDRLASVGTLAAGVAHEINNPLAVVVSNIELTQRCLSDAGDLCAPPDVVRDVTEQLEDAREAADRIRQVVKDLKIFSRAEDENRSGPVDVERVLDSTLRMAWNEIRHRARLVKDYGGVPTVCGNESRLGQVFLNLVMNAAEAIPEGFAADNEIRVSTRLGLDGRITVDIADTGCGIPAHVQRRLFTPFFTTKPVGQGTGLGLSICHRLVSEMAGRIGLHGSSPSGSVFRVSLPLCDETTGPVPLTAPAPRPSVRRGRVLVVDDDATIGRAVGRILGGEHDVTTTTSGLDALALVRTGKSFDVILCDLMMPQMTGMDLYEELLRVAPEAAERTVFLTAGAFTPRARAFLDAVPNQRLEKPYEVQQLRQLVNALVRSLG